MRAVVLQMGVTLDGFVHGAKGRFPSGTTIHTYRPHEGNR